MRCIREKSELLAFTRIWNCYNRMLMREPCCGDFGLDAIERHHLAADLGKALHAPNNPYESFVINGDAVPCQPFGAGSIAPGRLART